ncbi:MAG: phytanoyl-CoA dioxygenase family protein [Phycicoccus sp.]
MTTASTTAAPAGAATLLTGDELEPYERDGYVVIPPDRLTGSLLERARDALPGLLASEGDERVLERDGETVRSVYGVHRLDDDVAAMTRDPQLLGAVEQVLGDRAYVHQSKVNVKASFSGDQWEWHQDYVYWVQHDALARPELVNVALFLDDVTEFNGPLTFVPGSHRDGILSGTSNEGMPLGYDEAPQWVATLTATEQFRIEPETIARLAESKGLVAPKGKAGSVMLFHPNILHASSANISPFPRRLLMFIYNSMSNLGESGEDPRPWFLAEPEPVALEAAP